MNNAKIFRDTLIIAVSLLIVTCTLSCKEKPVSRKVGIDQVDDDGSTRDSYIFREEISREREDTEQRLRDEFRRK